MIGGAAASRSRLFSKMRGSLESALAEGPLPAGQAVRVATDLLAALAVRHARGAVHGRISAAHVELGDPATLAEPEHAPVSHHDQAPEQLEGAPASVSTDLFAVAILLYRSLCGEFPFPGQNLTEVVDSHLAGPRPLPRGLVTPALAGVLEAALQRRPAARPHSAVALATLLRDATAPDDNLVIEERPPGRTPRGQLPGVDQLLFDRFRVVSVMSQRAWDVMYLVKDQQGGGRLLTLRVGRPDAPMAQVKLEHEVAVLRTISNQFVVRVIESGFDDGLPWTLYQPLRGTTLRSRMHGGPFDVEDAVGVIIQLLEGLRAVHAAGWVHRDVSPDNLLEEVPETYRLAGFDLAMRADPEPDEDRAIAGTPHYMAPEIFSGGPIGPQTDLFTAGVVLYELLAGKQPYVTNDLQRLIYEIQHQPPPPLPPSAAWPAHIEEALARAMAKDPADRFPDAASMRLAVLGVETP